MLEKITKKPMENHILPFLWIHGEDEKTYRKMVNVIHNANIGAFCVEARPHPEFCKKQWWDDMAVILDEAEKLEMKVWILDDKHFPTGFAAGAVKDAPLSKKRRNITHKSISVKSGQTIHISCEKQIKPNDHWGLMGTIMLLYSNEMKFPKKINKDEILSCTAWSGDTYIDLMSQIQNGKLVWKVPDSGNWKIELCGLTYDSGMHRDYMNMLEMDSCKILIDTVYESHYEHFGEKFGTVIAGFFSDEPELGNGNYLKHGNILGTDQSLPYSDTLAQKLKEALGENWKELLSYLWTNHENEKETARVRYLYMDCVTRLVEECFSKQVGMWCRNHGVEYIGHMIEDNNQHARTSGSLGHYFRGLAWQTMAGIDDIGDQIMQGGEDRQHKTLFGYKNDGEFYHYAMGKLGTSLGSLNPNMNGRAMCEVFGNYGWSEGIQLEKYILDHLMVRGINYFVPHAFTCSAYPEKDCPPHFFAQGNNPQYRHFGELMKYTNRICNLISDGIIKEEIAILYHGEAEWAGKCMLMQNPARILADHQIDFVFMPSDVFEEPSFYNLSISDIFSVNGREQRLLIVPYMEYIPASAATGIEELIRQKIDVVFIDALPSGMATGEALPECIKQAEVVKLESLLEYVESRNLKPIKIVPENNRIRIMHYQVKDDIFFLVNEGETKYEGEVILPITTKLYGYDAWSDQTFELNQKEDENSGVKIHIQLDAYKSLLILSGDSDDLVMSEPLKLHGRKENLTNFSQSVCRGIDYPVFENVKEITKLEGYEKTNKKFSGYIRYESAFQSNGKEKIILQITEAYEGVEVFVNDKSAGIQIVPDYVFELTDFCKEGDNKLVIEVATTLARENGQKIGATGITGEVNLFFQ